jgi:uncharacterized protein YPO0396
MMKKLTKIRLINWHYFANETIDINGSFLITGENTSGKSTILDAIQLVLTTNTRKFNIAANEKSKRDLKGYVRCKTGNEKSAYLRKGSVISYVALEFFDEKKGSCFTLGVKIDSPDEEGKLIEKWFCEEGKLEEFSFLTARRPSMTAEFMKNDRKVKLINRTKEAKDRFRRRMGSLDERFFDMIPKSLAFKPMDNVKDFINKFILQEKKIEVDSLRKNIALLKNFEDLMEKTKRMILSLDEILNKNQNIQATDHEIRINDILIHKAELEEMKGAIEDQKKALHILRKRLDQTSIRKEDASGRYERENNRLAELKAAHQTHEIANLIREITHEIEKMDTRKNGLDQDYLKLDAMIKKLIQALTLLGKEGSFIVKKEHVLRFKAAESNAGENQELAYEIEKLLKDNKERYSNELWQTTHRLKEIEDQKIKLEAEIKSLKNHQLTYPVNTRKLKTAIEAEFQKQKIESPVRIFSDLLDITDPQWHNAIEGYLNSQRFYILVDPAHYDIALRVYDRVRKEVHTVGLVNTGKLDLKERQNANSLASLAISENRYAQAYANYLLNRVIRCNHVDELKQHSVAMTADCMLYKNHAVRKINENVYHPPYIGAGAYKIQLEMKEKELTSLLEDKRILKKRQNEIEPIKVAIENCGMQVIQDYLYVPSEREVVRKHLSELQAQLKKAKSNPNYIEIQMEVDECVKKVKRYKQESDELIGKVTRIEKDIEFSEKTSKNQEAGFQVQARAFESLCEKEAIVSAEGLKKFKEQCKTKKPGVISKNFKKYNLGLENNKEKLVDKLKDKQRAYCNDNDYDFGTGIDVMEAYQSEYTKLVSSEIIKYEEQLNQAKIDCEQEFRESFLARLKENIDNAKHEFKTLNRALRGIYYGEDNYKFIISSNPKKESLYKMIMADENLSGVNLYSESYKKAYEDEMNDLFEKLTAYDDLGDRVMEEYTDYRRYLDYDIQVSKKDGSSQRFSKIYGEKSGGETQTPFYVAIAASFVQLYQSGDTIRIIMLDEAFDKMDENRIGAMMDFFNTQNFQIILATPPAKMEVIGEKVDTILMAARKGSNALVEVYDL